MQENKFLIPLAIVVAGGLVAGAIYFGSTGSPQAAKRQLTTGTNIDIPAVTEKDHIRGSRDTKLVIVEYSDTECPYCKTFHNTMKEILRSYGADVAWVYRQFPIPQLHARASKEAVATECAAELGGDIAFWSYLDKIFEITESNDSLDPAELPKIAATVGLDVNAFNACLSSGRYTEFITKSIAEAIKAGALGTPYSIVIAKDGTKTVINGAEPLSSLKVKLDTLLK
ncbi:MAG: thioredoxin domain-containing protein [Patescibacteria group bacterium]|mgnify:CR=1 FL=1